LPSIFLKDGKVLLRDGKVAVSEACCDCSNRYWVVFLHFEVYSCCYPYCSELWPDKTIDELPSSFTAIGNSATGTYSVVLNNIQYQQTTGYRIYEGYTCIPTGSASRSIVPNKFTVYIDGKYVEIPVWTQSDDPVELCPEKIEFDWETGYNATHTGFGEYHFECDEISITKEEECSGPAPYPIMFENDCFCCGGGEVGGTFYYPKGSNCSVSVNDFKYDKASFPDVELDLEQDKHDPSNYTLHVYNYKRVSFIADIDWCPCCYVDDKGIPVCPDEINVELKVTAYNGSSDTDRWTSDIISVTFKIEKGKCPWKDGKFEGPVPYDGGVPSVDPLYGVKSECVRLCVPQKLKYDFSMKHPCDEASIESSYNVSTITLSDAELEDHDCGNNPIPIYISISGDLYKDGQPVCCDGGVGVLVMDACCYDQEHGGSTCSVLVDSHGGIVVDGYEVPDGWSGAWWFACGMGKCQEWHDVSLKGSGCVVHVDCDDTPSRCHLGISLYYMQDHIIEISISPVGASSCSYDPEDVPATISCGGQSLQIWLAKGFDYYYNNTVENLCSHSDVKPFLNALCCERPILRVSGEVWAHWPPWEGDEVGVIPMSSEDLGNGRKRFYAYGTYIPPLSSITVTVELEGSLVDPDVDVMVVPTDGYIEVSSCYESCRVPVNETTMSGSCIICVCADERKVNWSAHNLDGYDLHEISNYIDFSSGEGYVRIGISPGPNIPELEVDTSGGGWSDPPQASSSGPARIMSAPSGYTPGKYRIKAPAGTAIAEPDYGRRGAKEWRYKNGDTWPERMPAGTTTLKIEWQYDYKIHVVFACKCEPCPSCYGKAMDTTGKLADEEVDFVVTDPKCPGETYWDATGEVWVDEEEIEWTFDGAEDETEDGVWCKENGIMAEQESPDRLYGEGVCYYQWTDHSADFDALHPGTIDVSPDWDIDDPGRWEGNIPGLGHFCASPMGLVFKVTISDTKDGGEFYTPPLTMFGHMRRKSYAHGDPDKPGTARIYPCSIDRSSTAADALVTSSQYPHCYIPVCVLNPIIHNDHSFKEGCLDVTCECLGQAVPGMPGLQPLPWWIKVWPFAYMKCGDVEDCIGMTEEQDGHHHPHKSCITISRDGCCWAVHIVPRVRVYHIPVSYYLTFRTESGGMGCTPDDFQTMYVFPENEDISGMTFPEPECPCYTFEGWDPPIPTVMDQDYVVTAKWSYTTYSVTYDLNGGHWPKNALVWTSYTCYSLPKALPVPTSCRRFLYWEDQDGTIIHSGMITVDSSGDKHLTAKYDQQAQTVFTISYDADGGTIPPENPTSFTEADLPIVLSPSVKSCYDFLGWEDTGTGDVVSTIDSCDDLSFKAKWLGDQVVVPVLCGLSCNGVYVVQESERINARYGDELRVHAPDITGYRLAQSESDTKTLTVECGVTNELRFEYECIDYTLTIDPGSAPYPEMTYVKHYGDDISYELLYAENNVSFPCHSFSGWQPHPGIQQTMPASNLVETMGWSSDSATVYVVGRNFCNGSEQSSGIVGAIQSAYDSSVTVYGADYASTGYALSGDEDQSKTITVECGESNTIVFRYTCIDYTLTIVVDDGRTVVHTRHYGDSIEADLADAINEYSPAGKTFRGWSPDPGEHPTMPASNYTVSAVWDTVYLEVVFRDYDGSEILSTMVPYGTRWDNECPDSNDSNDSNDQSGCITKPDPTKESDADYCYEFDRWDGAPEIVTEDVEVTALYTETPTMCYVDGPDRKYFCKLADALAAVRNGHGSSVVLVGDDIMQQDDAYVIDFPVYVDLAGHRVERRTGTGSGRGVFDVVLHGDLTIASSDASNYGYIVGEYAVYVDGGAFEAADSPRHGAGVKYDGTYISVNVDSGSAVLSSGTFLKQAHRSGGVLTICGGSFVGSNPCTLPSPGCGAYTAPCGPIGATYDQSSSAYTLISMDSAYGYSVDGILYGSVADAIAAVDRSSGSFVESLQDISADIASAGLSVGSSGTCSGSLSGSTWHWYEVGGQ